MFSSKIFSFLKEISENNNRDWFEINKPKYLECKQDLEKFCKEVIPGLQIFDHTLRDPELKGYIFRIYRDARFAKGRPYKEHFGLLFLRGGKPDFHSFAGYYLHIEPNNSFVVSGAYAPERKWLNAIREKISTNSQSLRKIIESKEFSENFHLEGAQLKTAPRGYEKDHKEIDLLRYKDLYIMHKFSDKEILAKKFPEHLVQVCKKMYPFNSWLNMCLEEKNI